MSGLNGQVQSDGQNSDFFDAIIKAFTKPSVTTFRSFLQDPGATAGKGFLWVAIASALSAIISAAIFQFSPSNPILQSMGDLGYLDGGAIAEGIFSGVLGSIIWVICALPAGMIAGVIGLAIIAGILHLIASMLGGNGEFGKLVYALAVIQVPFSIISSILTIHPILSCLSVLIGIYVLVLEVMAIDAVYGFGTAKSVLTLFVPVIVLCLVVACLAALAVAAMGPFIEEVFNEIQRGIYP